MKKLSIILGLAMVAVCAPAWADFIPISVPSGAYLSGTNLVQFPGPDGTIISSSTDGTQTLSYSTPLTELSVPNTWYLWNSPPYVESSTPPVGYTNGATSLTITLSLPSSTFGFELEPDDFFLDPVDVVFNNSGGPVGSIDLSVNGYGGALLFAATSNTTQFTSVTITDLAPGDFAIAEQRYGPTVTPEPASYVLFAPILAVLAIGLRRRRAAEMAG